MGIQIFVVIDALDEYPEPHRPELLHAIRLLAGEDFQHTHILVSSRAENDIKYSIGSLATESISINKEQVDADIELHIKACLVEDPRLSRLPESIKHMVALKLGNGAQGM